MFDSFFVLGFVVVFPTFTTAADEKWLYELDLFLTSSNYSLAQALTFMILSSLRRVRDNEFLPLSERPRTLLSNIG
jgi:hypothetical protein